MGLLEATVTEAVELAVVVVVEKRASPEYGRGELAVETAGQEEMGDQAALVEEAKAAVPAAAAAAMVEDVKGMVAEEMGAAMAATVVGEEAMEEAAGGSEEEPAGRAGKTRFYLACIQQRGSCGQKIRPPLRR